MDKQFFKGRKLLIATKHKKELALKAAFEKHLGVECFVSELYDTDVFGTFTGEIERSADPITTVRNKCLKGLELVDCDLGVASEGSFGLHPLLPVPADDELLCFIDKKHTLEILVRQLTLDTNFDGRDISSQTELENFASGVKFPSHSLIIKKAKHDSNFVIKGINSWKELKRIYHKFYERFGCAYFETDMRAHHNPTRMSVIENLGNRLAAQMATLCPGCGWPGFGVKESRSGLPCGQCGAPTRSALLHIHTCERCALERQEFYPNGTSIEDPAFCDFCNP